MLKIALTTQCFPPDIGGIETYMGDITRHLREQGLDVHVFADKTKTKSTVPTRQIHTKHFGGPRLLRRRLKGLAISKFLKANSDTILLADTWKSLEAINPRSTPTVLFAHGNEFLLDPGTQKFTRAQAATYKANIILANSTYTASLVEKLGVPRERIHVFNIPVSNQAIPSTQACDALEKYIGRFDRIIVTIARIEKRKGIDSVIEVMPRVLASHSKTGYIIAGDGDYRSEVEAKATSLKIDNSVVFLGRISEDMKAALLSRAYVFVMPTRIEPLSVEGFGISFMEAAWYGVPSIGTDAGGVPDAVLDQLTGLICHADDNNDLYEAIDKVLNSEALRDKLGIAARERAHNKLNWNNGIRELISIFQANPT